MICFDPDNRRSGAEGCDVDTACKHVEMGRDVIIIPGSSSHWIADFYELIAHADSPAKSKNVLWLASTSYGDDYKKVLGRCVHVVDHYPLENNHGE